MTAEDRAALAEHIVRKKVEWAMREVEMRKQQEAKEAAPETFVATDDDLPESLR